MDNANSARTRRRWVPVTVEGTASLVAMLAIIMLFGNWLDAYLTFLGAPVVVTEEEVRKYWISLSVLVAALVTSFGAAGWRRARKAWAWHLLVGLVGAAAAVLFAVTTPGIPSDPEPTQPASHHTGPGCHSGGDSRGCPGG